MLKSFLYLSVCNVKLRGYESRERKACIRGWQGSGTNAVLRIVEWRLSMKRRGEEGNREGGRGRQMGREREGGDGEGRNDATVTSFSVLCKFILSQTKISNCCDDY